MDDQRQTVREAAILIASLEQHLADKLLGRLSPTEAARLRVALSRLGDVDPDEQQTLVVQFRRARAGVPPPRDTGVILEGALARHSTSPDPAPAASQERPFRFLSDADPLALVPFLKREHGQVAAIVLSHLPPEHAAHVLTALPAAMQVDVVQRLANLDTADEESLQVIARELEAWMDEQRRHGQRRAAGLQAVGGILAAASPTQQQTVVTNLQAANQSLARQVVAATPLAPRPIATSLPAERVHHKIDFDDLSQLDRDRLADLATTAEPEIIVLALAGASDLLTTRLLDTLPRSQSDRIRHQLNQLGPIRLSDVEAAQRELTHLAMTLDTQDTPVRARAEMALAGS